MVAGGRYGLIYGTTGTSRLAELVDQDTLPFLVASGSGQRTSHFHEPSANDREKRVVGPDRRVGDPVRGTRAQGVERG
jgi:hypothetical protein